MASVRFRGLCLSLLVLFVTALPAYGQKNMPEELRRFEPAAPAATRPLAEVVKADGSLVLPPGYRGSFDASGWKVVSGQGEAPRFAPAASAEKDASWSTDFSAPGTSEQIRAVAIRGDEIFIGGTFTTVGKTVANNVARWDGSAWHALGEAEKNGVDGSVYSLAVTDTDVYVGGSFFHAGGRLVNGVARFDGAAWHHLGSDENPGLNGFFLLVYAVAVAGENVYVGGFFQEAGGQPASSFAVWNRSSNTWAEAHGGVRQSDPDDPAYVYTIAVSGSSLYLGGKFERVGGVAAKNIAKIDLARNRASALGTGADDWVNRIVVSGSTVYAAGFFKRAGGRLVNNVAKWNGRGWQALGSGLRMDAPGGVGIRILGLTLVDGQLYVSGHFTHAGNVRVDSVARWDGARWSNLDSGLRAGIRIRRIGDAFAMAGDSNGIYVAGFLNRAGSTEAHQIARWSPRDRVWTAVADAGPHLGVYDGLVNTVAVNGNDVYVGGAEMIVGGTVAYGIAKWDGRTWSTLGEGESNGVNGFINKIVFAPDGSLYVGGFFSRAGDVTSFHVARWDGREWSSLGYGVGGPPYSQVFALAVDGSDLYVGGLFTDASGTPVNNIARWDGEAWHPLGVPPYDGIDPYGIVFALEATKGALYVGGFFYEAGGVYVGSIARWDGREWSPFEGGGIDGLVYDIAADGEKVYVAGSFSSAGSVPANNIAVNTGSGWEALGDGLQSAEFDFAYGNSLTVENGVLYVGGYFERAGDLVANGLAAWDGQGWVSLGGTNGVVGTVTTGNGSLYIAGGFSTTGGVASSKIARRAID